MGDLAKITGLGLVKFMCGPAISIRQVPHNHIGFAFDEGGGLQVWLGKQHL